MSVGVRVAFTLRLFEVKGLTISGGMSKPGGQGREKLLSKYLPLIASSTSLSINEQPINSQNPPSVSALNYS